MPIGPPNSWLKCFRALLSLWLLSGGLDAEESRALDASEEASDAASAFWSVKPVVEIKRPNVKALDWPRQPMDFHVLASMEAHGLTPAPQAGARTLARRLH